MLKVFLRLLGALSLIFVAGVGGLVLWSWAPDVLVERLKARWAGPPSQFVAIDGINVHLRDEGPRDDPTPLLLLHGMSSSLHTFDGWAERLSPSRRVIRIDLPGFGLTGPRPDGAYDPESYGKFLLALLDRLGVPRVIAAGNSFGGGLAWQLALRAPDRVAALILIDATGYPTKPMEMPALLRVAQRPPFSQLFNYVLPRGLIESSLREAYGDPRKVTPDLVDLYFDMGVREGNREALMTRMGNMNANARGDRIVGVRQPTLILWGGRDRMVSPDNAARFHADIVGSRLETFPDLGHVPQEEDAARTVAVVESFLRDTRPEKAL